MKIRTLASLMPLFCLSTYALAGGPDAPDSMNTTRNHFFVGTFGDMGTMTANDQAVIADIYITSSNSSFIGSLGVSGGYAFKVAEYTMLNFSTEFAQFFGKTVPNSIASPDGQGAFKDIFVPEQQLNLRLGPEFAINSKVHFSPEAGVSWLFFEDRGYPTPASGYSYTPKFYKNYAAFGLVAGITMNYFSSLQHQFNFGIDYIQYFNKALSGSPPLQDQGGTLVNPANARKVSLNMLLFKAGYQFNV